MPSQLQIRTSVCCILSSCTAKLDQICVSYRIFSGWRSDWKNFCQRLYFKWAKMSKYCATNLPRSRIYTFSKIHPFRSKTFQYCICQKEGRLWPSYYWLWISNGIRRITFDKNWKTLRVMNKVFINI